MIFDLSSLGNEFVSALCLAMTKTGVVVLLVDAIEVGSLGCPDLALFLETLAHLRISVNHPFHDELEHGFLAVVLSRVELGHHGELETIGPTLCCAAVHDVTNSQGHSQDLVES